MVRRYALALGLVGAASLLLRLFLRLPPGRGRRRRHGYGCRWRRGPRRWRFGGRWRPLL